MGFGRQQQLDRLLQARPLSGEGIAWIRHALLVSRVIAIVLVHRGVRNPMSAQPEKLRSEKPQPEQHGEDVDRGDEWQQLRDRYLRPERPASSARGVHHLALLSSDVSRTIDFYQGVLEFPLTELFENRDYQGSTHFFFDIGNGNALAFFDFPGLDLGPYAEVLGSMHHLAISVTPESQAHLRTKLEAAGVQIDFEHGTSIYFSGPDGERLELLADQLGEMYGNSVL